MCIPSIRLAIAADFFGAFSKLPPSVQGKIGNFIGDFKSNPTKPGLNYESITNARDSNLKSLRVDKTYRAIVRKPDRGNTYLLLWIAKHDEAYQWAQNRLCKINPESGGLQIIDVERVKNLEAELSQRNHSQSERRFKDISNRHLLRLGIPEELLESVRAVVTDNDIDKLLPQLPEEAGEAIIALGAGYSLNYVLEQQKSEDKEIDTDNIDAALDRNDSKQRFYVVEDDRDLLEILAAPLEKWRVFLHPSQRKLVERDWHGPVRILGGAGTGKTVVAMHRAKWLAQHRFTQESDRIFFTTFTRNLAIDIETNLKKICSPELMKRIHVENIDAWVVNFLKSEGIKTKIIYSEQDKQKLWEQAYTIAPSSPSLCLSFYQDEWREIIQTNGITTLKEYVKISRTGRGTSLKRSERVAIWPVFEEYRFLLQEKGLKEIEDALRDACSILKSKPGVILPFQSIIVDEAQDMSEGVFKLLRAMIPAKNSNNDIFIVGDPHQRIYERRVILNHCGIEVRGRSHKLKINYRTTEQIRKWATAILEGIDFDDLNGQSDDLKDYRSLLAGEEPIIKGFSSFEEEVQFLAEKLTQISEYTSLKGICLVFRTKKLAENYCHALEEYNLSTHRIRANEADNQSIPGIRIATMHRVKGLQFEYVFLPSINQGIIPLDIALKNSSDETTYENIVNLERCLMHVAATRAKQGVIITYNGKPSPLL